MTRARQTSERSHMKGKRLLGIALAISSLSLLLVAAATAGPTATEGRDDRARHDNGRRLHRPAALVLRRDVEARGHDGLQADELARQGGPGRRRRDAGGRLRAAARLEGRQDLHVHHQAGLQVLERQGRHRTELRRCGEPLRQPEDAVDRRRVPRHHQGRAGCGGRQGGLRLGRQGPGQQARRSS